MQGKVGRRVGFSKVSLVLKESLRSLGLGKRRRGSEGLSLLALPSTVNKFGHVLPTLSFKSQVGCHVYPGNKVLVDCSSLQGKGCGRVARIEGFFRPWRATGAGVRRWGRLPGVCFGFPCLLEEFESTQQLC